MHHHTPMSCWVQSETAGVQLQLLFQILTVQRQVFDFLGYMWLPIIANFMNILLIIFGSFGAVQYVTKYLLAVSTNTNTVGCVWLLVLSHKISLFLSILQYAIWSCMWLTWNIFLICYYLNLGTLDRVSWQQNLRKLSWGLKKYNFWWFKEAHTGRAECNCMLKPEVRLHLGANTTKGAHIENPPCGTYSCLQSWHSNTI